VTKKIESTGKLFKVRVEPRHEASGDYHAFVVVYVEDDGVYHRDMGFSSYWLDDLITTLQDVKKQMEHLPNNGRYGKKLKR